MAWLLVEELSFAASLLCRLNKKVSFKRFFYANYIQKVLFQIKIFV